MAKITDQKTRRLETKVRQRQERIKKIGNTFGSGDKTMKNKPKRADLPHEKIIKKLLEKSPSRIMAKKLRDMLGGTGTSKKKPKVVPGGPWNPKDKKDPVPGGPYKPRKGPRYMKPMKKKPPKRAPGRKSK